MARRIAVTGSAGQLGRELVRAYRDAGDELLALARPDFDITRPDDLDRLTALHPDIVINSAAWTDVDGCALDPDRAMRINGEAAGAVAEAAARAGALMVQISTNEVFDGLLDRPYTEEDSPNPINPYGASKLAGERLVAAANRRHLIVRTAWLFGPGGSNFVTKILAAAERAKAAGQPLRVVDDEWGNPTWVPALARAIVRAVAVLPITRGTLHLAGMPASTRWEWATVALDGAGTTLRIEPISRSAYARSSSPPARAVLATERSERLGIPIGDWREVTREYAAQL